MDVTDLQAIEAEAVRSSWAAWFETFGTIVDKEGNLVGAGADGGEMLEANYLQSQISDLVERLDELGLPVRLLVLKPRQRGCSTFSTAGLYHRAASRPTKAVIVGAKEDQSKNLLAMVRTYSGMDKFDWGCRRTVKAEDAVFSFGSGESSKIGLMSAKEYDPGRSGTYQFVLCTEVARWAESGVANSREVLAGLLKCVAPKPGTTIIQETTAKGASGDFYTRWLGSMEPEEFFAAYESGQLVEGKYIRVFAPWFAFEDCVPETELSPKQEDEVRKSLGKVSRYTCPEFGPEPAIMERFGLTVEQMAWRRWAIDEECDKDASLFNQDYPSTWQTAFLTSGTRVFNSAGLRRIELEARTRVPELGVLEWPVARGRLGVDKDRVVWRAAEPDEALVKRWEPPREKERYLIAADTMTGASQTVSADPDRHSVWVLRAGKWVHGRGWQRPAAVARIVGPCMWDIDELDDYIRRLHVLYRGATVCPEMNNSGLALVELLKKWDAPIYQREVYSQTERKMTKQLGWQTNTATRPMMLGVLKKAIREFETDGEGFDLWDLDALKELRAFVRNPKTGKEEAMQGEHDDDVFGLAIGLTLIDAAAMYQEVEVSRFVPADLRDIEMEDDDSWLGGQYS